MPRAKSTGRKLRNIQAKRRKEKREEKEKRRKR